MFFTGKDVQVPAIRRVALIDLDVHHGNGTEELVKIFKSLLFTQFAILYVQNVTFPGI